MHYFIALDFDEESCETIHSYAALLKSQAKKARCVRKPQIHLTLSFLGKLENNELNKVKRIVKGIEQSDFVLEFNHVSFFEPRKGGVIVWVGPTENTALKHLHAYLTKALKNANLTVDDRPFIPHVTLARDVRISQERFLDFKNSFKPFTLSVNSMSLVCSSFKEGQVTHTPVVRIPLK